MPDNKNKSLFGDLTRLFRSGPVIKRKIKNSSNKANNSSAYEMFRKSNSGVYNTAMSAYGSYDRMARTADFSEMEYCLHGDTLIATPNGYEKISDLSEKYDHTESFIVYSYDHNKKQLVPALGKQARQTRFDHAYKVTFDSGKEIIGTANHKLMLRDGSYKRIDELSAGDSMMPFYRRDHFAKNGEKETSDGYRWIYTMDYNNSTLKNGWIAEHRLIASWSAGKDLNELSSDDVVHHKNFVKHDNRPENLQLMTEFDHKSYHAKIINGYKWDKEKNSDWIEGFKKKHSEFMKENNPAERKDITYGLILELCERDGFNINTLCKTLNTDKNVIKRRLRKNGFDNFITFAKSYDSGWKNNGWNNTGKNNPRYDHSLTFQMICNAYTPDLDKHTLATKLDTTIHKIHGRLKNNGFKTFNDFAENYANHKVVSIEYFDEIPLYDLTVDGYKNFATDSVISHNTPELSSALDIYSEETVASDESGTVLHIHSENPKVKELLEELFIDTLNIEFNLTSWVRNLVKYGDFFLFNDVSPDYGVVNAFPIPVNEIEREEGYDPDDPMAVRFRWVTQGNQVLENWQISHFRLLGNDAFLPYGSSVLEPARRIWRQLILIEDAMLVYRVVRSPERRVFKIDVGNVPPEDISNYMEQVQTSLKRNQVIDSSTGRVDLRYNPMSVDEDYYLPVRGSDSGTNIETLAGGANTTAIEDVEYIQKKLFAALKIPKAYLGYDDGLGAKATLSQEDVRFSRSIARIQRTVISELNKIAVIHLYSNGFDGDDLIDFSLSLSNPSTIAQQQKLELFRTRFEIAGQVPEGLVDREWIRKNIFKMTDEEIEWVEKGRLKDKLRDLDVESVVSTSDATVGMEMGAAEEPIMETQPLKGEIVTDNEQEVESLSITDEDAPLRAQEKVNRITASELIKTDTSGPKKEKKYRINKHGHKLPVTANNNIDHRPRKTNVNRYGANVRKHRYGKQDQDSMAHPYGSKPGRTLKTAVNAMKPLKPVIMEEKEIFDYNNYIDDKINENAKMTSDLKSTLRSLTSIKEITDNKDNKE